MYFKHHLCSYYDIVMWISIIPALVIIPYTLIISVCMCIILYICVHICYSMLILNCCIKHKQLEISVLHFPKMSIQAVGFLQTFLSNLHCQIDIHPIHCQDMVFVNDTGKEYLLSLGAVVQPNIYKHTYHI